MTIVEDKPVVEEEILPKISDLSSSIDSIPLVKRLKMVRQSLVSTGPRHFNMDRWFITFTGNGCSLSAVERINIKRCGTTACLAGHAALVARDVGIRVITTDDAVEWLGIKDCQPFNAFYWENRGCFSRKEQYKAVVDWLDERIYTEEQCG